MTSTQDYKEAKRQIDSIVHKLRETVTSLQGKENPNRYKSQITLAERRINALLIALELIEEKLPSDDSLS